MFSDEGYMLDMASGTKFRGKAIGDSIAGLASAFPDVHRELLDIYVAENVVVVEIAIRGTHKGELALASGTLAPTGKTIDVPCCDVYHLEGGKIISFHCYNLPSVMQQQLGNEHEPQEGTSADAHIVPGAGIEPAWGFPQGIFVPTTAFAAARLCVHLESGLYLYRVAPAAS
jgi:ketosteroid isomerase-like protein